MKIRSYLKNKKVSALCSKQVSTNKSNSKVKLNRLTFNQISLQRQLSSEQKACHSLIQESWDNDIYRTFEKSEPDAILKLTPNPIQQQRQQLNLIRDQKLASDQKPTYKENSLRKSHRISRTQQSHTKKVQPLSTKYASTNNSNDHLFVGKQVLCLTQYLISGPHWNLNSDQYSRKLQRSKYIRVLKQMKNRKNLKMEIKKTSTESSPMKSSEAQFAKNPSTMKKLYEKLDQQAGSLQKIFFRTQQAKKDQRSKSLRAAFEKSDKLHLGLSYSNRFF